MDALVEIVDQSIVHFHKRCSSVKPSSDHPGRYVLSFTDGTTHEADVVLGADGIKSAVRNAVVDDGDARVVFGNTVAYRGLVPLEKLKAAGLQSDLEKRPVCFIGPGKVSMRSARRKIDRLLNCLQHFILFPIRHNTIVSVPSGQFLCACPLSSIYVT